MVDDKEYAYFVYEVTSNSSKYFPDFEKRITELEDADIDLPPLLTAALGLTGEAGEFADHVKKLIFHGKNDYDTDRREKMILELGDVMWYVMQGCSGLNITLEELIQRNIDKLSARHSEGVFKSDY
jgi:NTP pyrophosphatase (non-canonical NTP hydrolase)